jgi:hypothetical protein
MIATLQAFTIILDNDILRLKNIGWGIYFK